MVGRKRFSSRLFRFMGVDLNCGCPSKTVNGNGGGASLLKQPETIYQATKAMRGAVPADLPVSVKVRLGWDCSSYCHEMPML
ncbi:tRNA-dihydrouridine synthase C [Proteus mirabilis]|uniref:tRNA-dihydrouridine synthase C n=1 Tax=Proteus mirabilis TaxID=584 RepID=A0A379FGV0_PROMI|nr:tRNA-dihydrouridine synthase C [Proteus mirabilis]